MTQFGRSTESHHVGAVDDLVREGLGRFVFVHRADKEHIFVDKQRNRENRLIAAHTDFHRNFAGSSISSFVRVDVTPDFQSIFDERIAIALDQGMEPLVKPTVERWFTEELRANAPAFLDDVREMVRTTPPVGYAGCARAVQNLDYMARLSGINKPVLIIAGAEDMATSAAGMRDMQAAIAGSEYVELSPASHLSNLEQPEAFTTAAQKFLAAQS